MPMKASQGSEAPTLACYCEKHLPVSICRQLTRGCLLIKAFDLASESSKTYVLENFVPCRTTFSTASKKSRSVATFLRARMANMPASVATERNSAPVVFGHNRAMRSNRIFLSTLMLYKSSAKKKI